MVSARGMSRKSAWALAGAAVLAAAVPLLVVVACSPGFAPDVFVPASRPESAQQFASGSLGVLQPGYWRRDKVVAYRYLIGGRLSDEEKAVYIGPPAEVFDAKNWQAQHEAQEAAKPVNQWRTQRAALLKIDVKTTPEIPQEKSIEIKRDGYVQTNSFLNCPDDAFVAAGASLRTRMKQWGAGSGDLANWLKGQDAVFSNCAKPGTMPEPAPAGASTLLRLDRDYQIAAAKFYSGDYDGAIAGFEAIGRSTSSPWQPWGEYLAARAEVRRAAMTAPATDWGSQAKFDTTLLGKAQERLKTVAAVGNPRVAQAASAELTFIEVRLDPKKRLNDAANALAGPRPDEDFAQDLADMLFLTTQQVTGDADLLRWMGKGGEVNPVSEWRSKHTEPWLVAALMTATAKDAGTGDIESAAAKVPSSSPAYVTVSYERARLMLERGDRAAARKLATSVIDGLSGDGTVATRNALLAERIQTASSYAEFLADAPRTVVDMQSQASYETPERSELPREQFDWDVAMAFNRQLPLARWMEAAKTKNLPAHLRSAIAMAAWLRAEGMGDETTVKDAASLLPQPLRSSADGVGFAATMLLLRNPGIRPYLEQGVQRSASYRVLDNYRDNWWCSKWGSVQEYSFDTVKHVTPPMPMTFLTDADKRAATAESQRLNALPYGVLWVGRRAIDYATAHPDDKDAAEALALTVRATRYGCFTGGDTDQASLDQKALSKEAFTLLHKQYPKSSWAAKTPYYY